MDDTDNALPNLHGLERLQRKSIIIHQLGSDSSPVYAFVINEPSIYKEAWEKKDTLNEVLRRKARHKPRV